MKKPYFFIMTQCSFRTSERIGKVTGVVFAENEEDASEKAWQLAGNDAACGLEVVPVPEDGFRYTVYKSQI